MKKFVVGVIFGMILATTASVYADEGLQKVEAYLRPTLPITLDGKSITLDNSPIMYDGATHIRLRDVAKLTGLQVNWNDATQTVELGSTIGGKSVATIQQTQPDENVINMLTPPVDPTLTSVEKIEVLKSRIDVLINVIRGLEIGLTHAESDNKEVKEKMEATLAGYKEQLANLQAQLNALQ
jgi:hypothetical protein